MNKRWIRRLVFTLIVVAIIVPAVMAAGWVGTETWVEETSDAEFCTTCHTMEPFAVSHEQDVHGGNNPGGVVAHCTDCHLPHDSAARHLFAKAKTGMRDAFAQAVYPIHKPDWLADLEERAEYVYDSGCLSCHAALKDATSDDPAALAAHQAYFGGDVGEGCVSCHEQVGHKNLKVMLDDHFAEVSLSEMPGDNGEASVNPPTPADETPAEGTPAKEGEPEQNATSSEDA
ncbi:MAG: cytochrome c3 family protein [Halochromatium sp.]|uniref:cytochrome c3 family protein n=1 Tax=Halochromatium sp. TaxID=2049430 RepID=UPI0039798B29